MNHRLSSSDSLRPVATILPVAKRTDGSESPLEVPLSILVFVWIIRFAAAANLIISLIHHRLDFASSLGTWIPFEISHGRYLRMFILSVLLFLLAAGLRRGKRTVWILTIVSLAIAPALHLGRGVIWPQELINLGLIAFLFFHRRYFVAQSDSRSVRFALILCPILAATLLVFGTIRLHDLRDETSGDDDWAACLQTATELVLVHNTRTQTAQTALTIDFFSILRIGGTLIAVLGLALTLRPVLLRRKLRIEHREKVRRLIDLHGQDPLDPYALLDDKNYFLTHDGQAAVPYVVSGGIAVALADPIGHPSQRPIAVSEFTHFCRLQDWEPVFYGVSRELLTTYEQAGFSMFKIGEDARLKADEFHLRGASFQNLRTARNRANKSGIGFRWYRADRGIDEVLESQLAEVSRGWLSRKRATEMNFDMGAWNLEDIRRNTVAIATNAAGKPLAFALWRSFARGNGQTLDLMRCLPDERNVMDHVLVESILYFKAQGINDISLGNAPLANTEGVASRLVAEEKAVQFLFENLNLIYRYKSLFEFKRKYRPQWRGRYVAYRRGVHLPLVGLALVRVHAREGLRRLLFG